MTTLSLFLSLHLSSIVFHAQEPQVYFRHDDYPSELRHLVEFYADHFDFDQTVVIYISLEQKLPRELNGYTVYSKNEVKNTHNIYIRIRRNLNRFELKSVITHEMIHAKQYVTQELKLNGAFQVFWKGKAIPDFRHIKYDERGWEHEAFSQTSRLVRLYNKTKADTTLTPKYARVRR